MAAVVGVVARHERLAIVFEVDGEAVAPNLDVEAVAADPWVLSRWGPWLPGFVREAMLSSGDRHRTGVHHTAPDLADAVLAVACAVAAPLDIHTTVADPAVGGGAFLLAAAGRMVGPRDEVVGRLLGCDIDPLAVAATCAALTLWSGGTAPPPGSVVVADFLDEDPFSKAPDLIVGNPPFLSQLRGDTIRTEETRTRIATRWSGVGRYVDGAAAFLLASADTVAPDGTVALIQPDSVLSALDARPIRARLAGFAPPAAIWVDDQRRFDAAVDTIAVVCRQGTNTTDVGLWSGVPASLDAHHQGGLSADSWAPYLAIQRGVPKLPEFPGGRTLGEIANVTAGFRDQFYGLRDAVADSPDAAVHLITSGLIDPLVNGWGSRPCRFDQRRWSHPGVDLERVAPAIGDWVADRLRPKVLVASQTRVIEAIVDARGDLLPCTPVISVEPGVDAPSLWHLAALLTCPVATVRLVQASTGSALSADAVRVSAARLATLPLPADTALWDEAASRAEAGDVSATGELMMAAHGLTDRTDLLVWWSDRLPVSKE